MHQGQLESRNSLRIQGRIKISFFKSDLTRNKVPASGNLLAVVGRGSGGGGGGMAQVEEVVCGGGGG